MKGVWPLRDLVIAALEWAVIFAIGGFFVHRLFVDWYSWLTGFGFAAFLFAIGSWLLNLYLWIRH